MEPKRLKDQHVIKMYEYNAADDSLLEKYPKVYYINDSGWVYHETFFMTVEDENFDRHLDSGVTAFTFNALGKLIHQETNIKGQFSSSVDVEWLGNNTYIEKSVFAGSAGEAKQPSSKKIHFTEIHEKRKTIFKQYENGKLVYRRVCNIDSSECHSILKGSTRRFHATWHFDSNGNLNRITSYSQPRLFHSKDKSISTPKKYRTHRKRKLNYVQAFFYDNRGLLVRSTYYSSWDGKTDTMRYEYITK